MPFNILLLPLIGGYLFIHRWHHTRIRALRLDKERLLFHAAFAGFLLLILAFTIKAIYPSFLLLPCVKWFPCLFDLGFQHLGVSILALALGWGLPIPLNRYGYLFGWTIEEESRRYSFEEGDPFEQLISEALDTVAPVMLTLKSGKVYVGLVVSSFVPSRDRLAIYIAPLHSGYREAGNKRLHLDTDYAEALEKILFDVERLRAEKLKAEQDLARLNEAHSSLEQKSVSLDEGDDREKGFIATVRDTLAVYVTQQAHLQTVIQSLEEEAAELEDAINEFGIVIRADEIVAASLFNAKIYAKYFADESKE